MKKVLNEIVKIVAEQKIRSMRLAGLKLQQTELNNSINLKQFSESNTEQLSEKPTLSQLGISKNELPADKI